LDPDPFVVVGPAAPVVVDRPGQLGAVEVDEEVVPHGHRRLDLHPDQADEAVPGGGARVAVAWRAARSSSRVIRTKCRPRRWAFDGTVRYSVARDTPSSAAVRSIVTASIPPSAKSRSTASTTASGSIVRGGRPRLRGAGGATSET